MLANTSTWSSLRTVLGQDEDELVLGDEEDDDQDQENEIQDEPMLSQEEEPPVTTLSGIVNMLLKF